MVNITVKTGAAGGFLGGAQRATARRSAAAHGRRCSRWAAKSGNPCEVCGGRPAADFTDDHAAGARLCADCSEYYGRMRPAFAGGGR